MMLNVNRQMSQKNTNLDSNSNTTPILPRAIDFDTFDSVVRLINDKRPGTLVKEININSRTVTLSITINSEKLPKEKVFYTKNYFVSEQLNPENYFNKQSKHIIQFGAPNKTYIHLFFQLTGSFSTTEYPHVKKIAQSEILTILSIMKIITRNESIGCSVGAHGVSLSPEEIHNKVISLI